jgi:4-hydroxy-tetrahydrodipicolinate synthase
MKALYPLRGIITVLNTPFTAKNTVDIPALKRHVEEALQAGVHGFLVPALAAEVYKLTIAERLKMVETVLTTVNGKVPVIAGAGETELHRSRH